MEKKFVLVITYSTDGPLRAISALTVANALLAQGSDLVVFLLNQGVLLGKRGAVDFLEAPPFPPARELLACLIKEGVKFYLCGNCTQIFKVRPEELIEGAEIAGAATLASLMAERETVTF